MGRPLPWFKLYHEARTDAKLRSLADDEFRVWFNLLCYAAEQSDDRGTIDASDLFLLAIEVANGDEELLRRTLQKLERLRIIEWPDEDGPTLVFTHFLDRQYDKPSDHPDRVSERVKRHRANNVTPLKRDVTPSNALDKSRVEKNRQEESREEHTLSAAPTVRDDYPPDFEAFWREYPTGHGSKKKAFAEWRKLKPDDALRAEIMTGLAAWQASERWQRGYVKQAELWLRDQLWPNPPPPPGTNGHAPPKTAAYHRDMAKLQTIIERGDTSEPIRDGQTRGHTPGLVAQN